MLNEDDEGPLGGFANILGSFGFGGMGSSESNLDKILELSKTRAISKKALFEQETLNEQTDFLANHIIHSLEKQDKWFKTGFFSFGADDGLSLENFRFRHDSFPSFTILENKALKKLHDYLTGREKYAGIFASDYSELSGIMKFSVTTDNPNLSIITVNNIYDNLSNYYQEKTAGKQRKDYEIIQTKYDSITNLLSSVQYSLAEFGDRNRNLFRKKDLMREKQLKGEEYKLSLIHI